MAESSRLFFALWPDEATRDEVAVLTAQFHKEYGGRPVARESLHITLAFLGETPNSRLPDLHLIGNNMVCPSFEVILNCAGCWSNGIFWLAPTEPPLALTRLVKTLNGELQAAGVTFDMKRFAPHMTLLRKTRYRGGERLICPISLNASSFVLVRTMLRSAGAQYEVMEKFPLGRSDSP
jgi:RNA 2',3'-cyclic 3'-phosphodiesterase